MADNRVAGTLFNDMKYIYLYHRLGFKETNPDVFVKRYDGCTVTINSEEQNFIFQDRQYQLSEHRDFVILELLDQLLFNGCLPGNITIDRTSLSVTGKKRIDIRCEQWGKDYKSTKGQTELNPNEAIYTSRLSGGMIDRLYVANIDGTLFSKGVIERLPGDIEPFNPHSNNTYDEAFIVEDDVLIEYVGDSTNVIIPNGITKVETGAFWNKVGVRKITVPDSVTSIGGDAFVYCYDLETVNIPSSVDDIGDDPFAGCPKLIVTNNSDYFRLIDGVLYTKDLTRLIHYTPSLPASEFTIPDSVEWIGKHSFYNCNNLETVTIGKNVDYIGNNVFSDCHNLVLINNSPNFVYRDGALMNKECTTIFHYSHGRDEDVYAIPDTVRTIGRNSFWNCKRLLKVIIGKNVRQIGYNPFANCDNLEFESHSPHFKSIDGALYDKDVRELICCTNRVVSENMVIPSTVKNIGRNSLSNCSSMKTVELPEGLESISRGAFNHCSGLKEVYVPDSVEIIEKWAFSYCDSLDKIYINRRTELNAETFTGTDVEVIFR